MNVNELVQAGLYFGLLIALTPLLGGYMARVFKGERTLLSPLLVPVEKLVYRLGGTAPAEEMSWLRYFWAAVIFNVLGILSLMALQMTQAHLEAMTTDDFWEVGASGNRYSRAFCLKAL